MVAFLSAGSSFFRRILDSEMRDGTCQGVSLATKQNEKEPVSYNDNEKLFWVKQLLGMKTAKTLLNTVYYYNGKM